MSKNINIIDTPFKTNTTTVDLLEVAKWLIDVTVECQLGVSRRRNHLEYSSGDSTLTWMIMHVFSTQSLAYMIFGPIEEFIH